MAKTNKQGFKKLQFFYSLPERNNFFAFQRIHSHTKTNTGVCLFFFFFGGGGGIGAGPPRHFGQKSIKNHNKNTF